MLCKMKNPLLRKNLAHSVGMFAVSGSSRKDSLGAATPVCRPTCGFNVGFRTPLARLCSVCRTPVRVAVGFLLRCTE